MVSGSNVILDLSCGSLLTTHSTLFIVKYQYVRGYYGDASPRKILEFYVVHLGADNTKVGLPPASPRNHHTDGTKANHALILKLDHSGGAD